MTRDAVATRGAAWSRRCQALGQSVRPLSFHTGGRLIVLCREWEEDFRILLSSNNHVNLLIIGLKCHVVTCTLTANM
jgi:hypothetical protein